MLLAFCYLTLKAWPEKTVIYIFLPDFIIRLCSCQFSKQDVTFRSYNALSARVTIRSKSAFEEMKK